MIPRQPACARCQIRRANRKMRESNNSFRARPIRRALFLCSREDKERKERIMAKRLFTSESVTEGTSRQDLRPDLRRGAGRHSGKGPQRPRRLRDAPPPPALSTSWARSPPAATWTFPRSRARSSARSATTARKYGFDCDTCAVITAIDEQSGDIAMGVDKSYENKEGGDERPRQRRRRPGHDVRLRLRRDAGADARCPSPWRTSWPSASTEVRKSGQLHLSAARRQDARSPSSTTRTATPVRVDTVVVSTQHDPEVDTGDHPRRDMIEQVIKPTIPAELLDDEHKVLRQPDRPLRHGRPGRRDSGLTGRKIIVDTYGGSAPHGGGCFSGKDPTKVDRSAAYAARCDGQEHRGCRSCAEAARCSWPTPSAWRIP